MDDNKQFELYKATGKKMEVMLRKGLNDILDVIIESLKLAESEGMPSFMAMGIVMICVNELKANLDSAGGDKLTLAVDVFGELQKRRPKQTDTPTPNKEYNQ